MRRENPPHFLVCQNTLTKQAYFMCFLSVFASINLVCVFLTESTLDKFYLINEFFCKKAINRVLDKYA